MDKVSFELLLVKDIGEQYQVVGITYSDAQYILADLIPLHATLDAIELCKKALVESKIITVSKVIAHNEVQSYELVIDAPTDLDRYKQVALNEVRARMHQQMLTHAVIEAMDYLDCFIKLCSYGYVISNSNREDKYFEIIEDSQSYEEPAPLSNDATLQDKEQYKKAKQQYDKSQEILNMLEQYLNLYDNLYEKPRRLINFFVNVRNVIQAAKTKDEIADQLRIYKSNLKNMHIVNVAE